MSLNIFKKLFNKDKETPEQQETNNPKDRIQSANLPSLRILTIADLHSCFPEDMEAIENISKNKYDCVILLGDIFENDVENIVKAVSPKPCYYVLGNHDRNGQNNGIDGLICMDGEKIEINGITLGGVSGGPRYKQGDFAMRTEKEIEEQLNKIGYVDILISHESPYHLMSNNTSHSGFEAITDYILEKHPYMHIFGHHHWQEETVLSDTLEYCIYKVAIVSSDGKVKHII